MPDIDIEILEIAKRRTVYASELARRLGVDVREVKTALRRLRKARKIDVTFSTAPGFWGGTEKGYRA